MDVSKHIPDGRFIEQRHLKKIPKEDDWNNNPKCLKDTTTEGLGFLLGDGFIAIDCDTKEMQRIVEETISTPTYTQLSAKRGLPQLIFKVNGSISSQPLKDSKGNSLGDLLSKGRQVILAPSKYKITADDVKKSSSNDLKVGDIKEYTILNDIPIAELEFSKLMELVGKFQTKINKDQNELKDREKRAKPKQNGVSWDKDAIDGLDITSIIDTSGLKMTSSQYFGANPYHDSTTGQNFWVTPSKNLAYCFRCDSAISPAKAIALNEGIISNCDDYLSGDNFIKTLEVAREKYGLDDGWLPLDDWIEKQNEEVLGQDQEEPLFWTMEDYEKLKPRKDHIIKGLKYPQEIIMSYGDSKSFKSMTRMLEGISIASGKNFLGEFNVRQQAVGYVSAENSTQTDKKRLKELKRGLKIRKRNIPFYLIPRNNCQNFLDPKFKKRLFKELREKNIKVLYIDTINPVTEIDDNSVKDVIMVFNYLLHPLSDELGICVDFLHHTTKTGKSYIGSMKWEAESDSVFKFERMGLNNFVNIMHTKGREGEGDTLKVGFEFLKDKIKASLLGSKEPTANGTEKKPKKSEVLKAKVTEILKENPEAQRKDIIAKLDEMKFEYSVSTLGRVLGELKNENKIL